jgi:GDSL-like Lipase/Acylhydrolase family
MTIPPQIRLLALWLAAIATGLVLLEGYIRLAEWSGYGSQVVVESKARDQTTIDLLKQGRSPFPPGTRSILVLGDSMAASIGIQPDKIWSTRLEKRLREDVDPTAVVVNAAVPGANTYSELILARQILPTLKPEVILLMYNANDVYGTHDVSNVTVDAPPPLPSADAGQDPAPPLSPKNGVRSVKLDSNVSLVARVGRLLKDHSKTLGIFLPRFNIQVKARGFLMPGTDYHHMATQAYLDDYEGWRLTRRELLELRDTCAQHGARLVIYVLPEFDSLKFDHSAGIRRSLIPYFASIGVPVSFGFDHFRGQEASELAISPYDGHPNAKANVEIADLILGWFEKINAFPKNRGGERLTAEGRETRP